MADTSYQRGKNLSRFKSGEKSKKEIKILGAGISGLTASIVLAKAGYKVKVFEKRSRIGSFLEKDVHSLKNYIYDYDIIKKYKKLGITISNFYPIYKEVRFSSSLESIEISSKKEPLFYNIIRGYGDGRSLDVDLFEQAKKKGVEFLFDQKINPKKNSMDIIATGARYRKGLVYGYHYKNVSMKPNAVYFFLNSNRSSYGYTYVNPFEKEASIAIVSPERDSKKYLKRRIGSIKKNKVIGKVIKKAKLENDFFGYAYFKLPKTAVKNGKLYVGEAAGFLDASTGFGVHYAIMSGYLAAQSIIEGKDYDKLWKNSFGEELKRRYLRRKSFKKMGIKKQKKMISKLIKKHGEKISMNDYMKIYKKIPQEVNV
jgi:flavin-dependent dehydrogenase